MERDSRSPSSRPRPAVLIVLDGFGVAPDGEGNAITLANTPNLKQFTERYPTMTLKASGDEVGLSWGEMGNSEVGHLTIGAGRVYYQTLPLINRAIADGSFVTNAAFHQAIAAVKASGGTMHLLGLMSAGKVHAFDDHGYQLLNLMQAEGLTDVAVHAILDGRDTLYNSGLDFLRNLDTNMLSAGVGYLASVSGRYYAMDRDNRWDRVEQAYQAIALGKSEHQTEDALSILEESYAREVFDEDFEPTVVTRGGQPRARVKPGDAVIFFNFRPDRARELTKAFVLPAFDKFPRDYIRNLTFVTMTEYEQGLPVSVAFPPVLVNKCLAEVLADAGLVQLHVAETEKYAHMTFFMNGTREDKFLNEDRVLIPSPQVTTYDQTPEMSAYVITDKVIQAIQRDNYDVIMVNFANPDMVGHTGNLPATIKAVEVVDECLGKIVSATLEREGVILITADHGNAEEVINLQTHAIDKEHSINPVPFWIISQALEGQASIAGDVPNGDLALMPPVGMLADVAPTLLAILGLERPEEMTGTPLM